MEKTEVQVPLREEVGTGYAGRVFRRIQTVIDDTGGQSGALVRVLQQAQGLVGYLPSPVLKTISRDLSIPLSEVYGIVSFYHFFTIVPRGKHVIQVCLGTSCYVKGGEKLLGVLKKTYGLEPGGITPDRKFSLETVRCLGCCGLSPVVAIGDDVYRKVRPSDMPDILSSYR
ncbi:MAG: NAD(P)H-dependent oxidoreductase subunit E [Chloroflexota bacterium]